MKLRQHWFSAVMSAVVFVFLFLPIIVVFKDAFNANKTLLTWGGATFTWFGEALSSERFRSAFLTSIGIAVWSCCFPWCSLRSARSECRK